PNTETYTLSLHDALPIYEAFYEKAQAAYRKIFDRLGLGDKTFLTFASGGSFAKFSHEFQTLSEAGEDTIYLDRAKKVAINKEVLDRKSTRLNSSHLVISY